MWRASTSACGNADQSASAQQEDHCSIESGPGCQPTGCTAAADDGLFTTSTGWLVASTPSRMTG